MTLALLSTVAIFSIVTNELVGTDPSMLKPFLEKVMRGEWKQYQGIPLWDGKTAQRIVDKIVELYA